MTITIGAVTFDHVDYDADDDVLYLSVGEPREPADSHGTPEGHNVRYDDLGQVIALTLVNAKWLLERRGRGARGHCASRVSADESAAISAATPPRLRSRPSRLRTQVVAVAGQPAGIAAASAIKPRLRRVA